MDVPELIQQMGAVGVIVVVWLTTWRWVLTRLSDDLGAIRDELHACTERLQQIERDLHDKQQ